MYSYQYNYPILSLVKQSEHGIKHGSANKAVDDRHQKKVQRHTSPYSKMINPRDVATRD